LKKDQLKFILDKVYRAGAIWLCFTGGDPLTRKDFLELYSYAKDKGFIITIFTNGYSMTKEIAGYLKKKPPFVIEMTLNAVTEELYEKISHVKGSFKKTMEGISLISKRKLPLKIKTQITKDNLEELPKIEKFVKGLGLKFRPSAILHARLTGNLTPCNLRIPPNEILGLNGKKELSDDDCDMAPETDNLKPKTDDHISPAGRRTPETNLFRCTISGGDGIHIDPYGNTFPCSLIRRPKFNLLKMDIEYASNKLSTLVRNRKFESNSICKSCNLREFCHWCPGKAKLETGDEEAPIPYYCEMAKLLNERYEHKLDSI
jgi:radical SAM protein with 4Fe4S-binding SPASM domain